MPTHGVLDPIAFPHALPRIWLCEWDSDRRSGRMRLAGYEIEHLFGRSFKGRWLEDAAGTATRGKYLAIYRRVAEEPCLHLASGRVYRLTRNLHGEGERMILPLSEDGHRVSHLHGVTDFTLSGEIPSSIERVKEGSGEGVHETFVPLNAASDWLARNS